MKRLLNILLCAMISLSGMAQTLSENAVISLLSCSPGKPLYFHYGHAAIRVQDDAVQLNGETESIDWTFNYGIFDFNQDGFYYKFVKGETDYMLGLEYTNYFIYDAAYSDRHVSYQPLLLTQEEKQAVFDALMENYRPENRYYRYNFVYDNCATRPWQILRNVRQDWVDEDELQKGCGVTWRQACDYYSGKWSWGKYGINLLFGYEADEEMTLEESLFLPENLMNYVSEIGWTEEEDIQAFTPRDGAFATSPELLTLVLVLLIIALTFVDQKRKKASWWFDETLYLVYFILGLIVFVMYFFSEHPFVGSNMNILFLNPLWLVPMVMLCKKNWRQWWYKLGLWLLIAQAGCLVAYVALSQTFHPVLILVLAHSFRIYWLGKKSLC